MTGGNLYRYLHSPETISWQTRLQMGKTIHKTRYLPTLYYTPLHSTLNPPLVPEGSAFGNVKTYVLTVGSFGKFAGTALLRSIDFGSVG